MVSLDVAAFIVGAALLTLAILGGVVVLEKVQIPAIPKSMRLVTFLMGCTFITIGIWIHPEKTKPESVVREKDFFNPDYKNERLDACLGFAHDCTGERAANRWCRQVQGFSAVADFDLDIEVGKRGIKTKTINDERVCDAEYCSAFKRITCKK